MSETDSLFSPEYAVTGGGARRVLKRLARRGLMLNLMTQGESDGRLASVIDQIGGEAGKLVLDQPPDLSHTLSEFARGQPIRLMWAEAGMRFGAQARVLRVYEQARSVSYEIAVEGSVYRQQRRQAFRVPVGPNDGVEVTFFLAGKPADLPATVKDISVTGCRFELSRRKLMAAGLARGREVGLRLLLDKGAQSFDCRMRVIWIRLANEEIADLGVAWIDPEDRLLEHIQRFVVRKERKLLKWRSGL